MTGDSSRAEALRAIVRGRVQGVGFRAFVTWNASELGLTGYARNLSDGRSVEVVAEGSMPALETLLVALRAGPPMAHVERVESSWMTATGEYRGFVGR